MIKYKDIQLIAFAYCGYTVLTSLMEGNLEPWKAFVGIPLLVAMWAYSRGEAEKEELEDLDNLIESLEKRKVEKAQE